MRRVPDHLLHALRCPSCGTAPLSAVREEQPRTGQIRCPGCAARYPLSNGVLRMLPPGRGPGETVESFGYQWTKVPSWNSGEKNARVIDAWVLRWFGWNTHEELRRHLEGRRTILDVGCGLGRELRNFAQANPVALLVGLEPSKTVDVCAELLKDCAAVHLVQGDITAPPFSEGSFDMVFSKGVLHHTPDTRAAFRACAALLRPGGELAVYLYNRKGPVREFTDDFLRRRITSLPSEEAWEVCKGFTELGEKLSAVKGEIVLERGIPLLGIKPGAHSLQRLVHYTIMKIFWNDALTFEENNLVNFDWYHPFFAWRHTPDEIRGWCRELGLAVAWLNEEPSGIALRAVRPQGVQRED
ncbi:MAG: methyltransferase domain-containing protein [Thermodesulfovibrionales bacterium]